MILTALLLLALATLLANLAALPGLRPAPVPADAPFVSILVPARDEAQNIEACVGSLLRQDYPRFEVIVLDDHSSDGTSALVERLFAEFPSVKTTLLRGEELPAGWAGKNWACHQLGRAARGDFLFFTDADTTHAPGLLAAAVAFSRRHRASLLSAWPRFLTHTLGEKIIVPVIVLIGTTMVHHWLLVLLQRFPALARRLGSRATRALGGANGQFMFFTRECYAAIGGHESVRGHVVEDVSLGREVAARIGSGLRLVNADSLHFSTVRMYRSFAEGWAGFTKNLRAAFDRQRLVFWVFVASLACVWLWPAVAWLRPEPGPVLLVNAALVFGIRALVTARWRLSWLSLLLHPLSIAVWLGIALNSWRLSRGRGVEWKGRRYRPEI